MNSLLRLFGRLLVPAFALALGACGSRSALRDPAPPVDGGGLPDVVFALDAATLASGVLGTEFWAAPTANSQLPATFSFGLVLGNPHDEVVTVRVTGGALAEALVQTLAPRSGTAIALPAVSALMQSGRALSEPATSALVEHGAYHVEASQPILAQQFNPLTYTDGAAYSHSNDASLLLPTRALGTEYLFEPEVNWPTSRGTGEAPHFGGFVTVVGAHAGPTRVTLISHVSVRAGLGVAASGGTSPILVGTPPPREFIVPPGAALQLVFNRNYASVGHAQLRADHPVAVFVGHDCRNVPADRSSCDHLEEQLVPRTMWGTQYALSAYRWREGRQTFLVRVVPPGPGFRLTASGLDLASLPEFNPVLGACRSVSDGDTCEFETSANFTLSGSAPFAVYQLMAGSGTPAPECCADPPVCAVVALLPQCMGDPSMTTVVPVDRYLAAYAFAVPDTYPLAFANVTARAPGDIAVDGVALVGPGEPAGDAFRAWVVPVAPGAHFANSPSGLTFGLQIYGVAPSTSYALPAGMRTD